MSYTNGLDKPTDYFNTKIYAPDGSSSFAVTGVGFQPDWVWLKSRSYNEDHQLNDSVRGATKGLQSNLTSAETTQSNGLTSFDSDGFTVGNLSDYNYNGDSIVSWNWLASNTTASNTDGSITSTVSANTTAGFSIVSWTGNGTNPTQIGHGLGTTPKMFIVKNRSDVSNWVVYNEVLGNTKALYLDLTDASGTVAAWNNTSPTSSVFTVNGANALNGSSDNMIAYCFAEKKGYSKFGSYTGNGNADGTFVYTGFKPAFLITKRTDSADNWGLLDNKRDGYNLTNKALTPNSSGAEYTSNSPAVDFLANGFKIRESDGVINGSGGTYIYMAFAENPFVSGASGIPCTAR